MFSVKVYNTIYDEALKKDWLDLQEGDDMTAFQFYDWNCMLEEEFKKNGLKKFFGRIRYFEVLENDVPILIAPLHIQKASLKMGALGYKKGIYFIGMRGYTDYLNFIYKTVSAESVAFLLDYVASFSKIKRFLITQIKENTVLNSLLKNMKSDKFVVEESSSENCVELALPETYQEFWDGISKNLKSNLKKQKNKYERENFSISYKLLTGKCDDLEILKRISEIHEERFSNKNKHNLINKLMNAVSQLKTNFDEIGYSLRNNEHTWLLLGTSGDKIISYFYGLKDNGGIRIMQLGFDDQYYKYMPGTITMLKYVEECGFNNGKIILDFTRGEERYKYELGGKQHTIFDYSIEVL